MSVQICAVLIWLETREVFKALIKSISLHMVCNKQIGTFGHLRKVLSRISLRYPRRLIRDDTLRLH